MCSSLLTSSRFGKFYPRCAHNVQTVELSACSQLEQLQFTITGDRLYLLDAHGNLTSLSLADTSLSTFTGLKLAHFEIESNNCFSVCGVNRQAELLRLSLQSKKYEKLANLGLTRVLSFQKNHLTNLLLVVEFQVALLLEVATGRRISALKAANGEVFSCGRFLDQNRFIVLAVRGSELRVVEILGMRAVERITLPFEIKGIKLEATLDGSAVAVYGDSNVLLLVKVSPYGKLSYQMAELPIRGILCARFTHQNDLLLLGSDRVLYGIHNSQNRLITLFNDEQKLRINCFDVALHTRTIALAAGKTLHLLTLEKGVRKALEEGEGVLVEFAKQGGGEHALKVEREFEDRKEDLSQGQKDAIICLKTALPPNLPNFNVQPQGELLPEVKELRASKSQLATINTIYLYLHTFQSSRKLVHIHKAEVLSFILRTLLLLKDPRQATIAVYHILTLLGTAITDGSLDKFTLILAPRVFQRIQKVEGQFGEFVGKGVLSLFQDYLSEYQQGEVLLALLRNLHREWFLPIFIVSLFLEMRGNSPTWPLPHQQQVRLHDVLAETDNLMSNPRHAYIFARELNQQQEPDGEQLEALLARQQQLKQSLQGLRKERS